MGIKITKAIVSKSSYFSQPFASNSEKKKQHN